MSADRCGSVSRPVLEGLLSVDRSPVRLRSELAIPRKIGRRRRLLEWLALTISSDPSGPIAARGDGNNTSRQSVENVRFCCRAQPQVLSDKASERPQSAADRSLACGLDAGIRVGLFLTAKVSLGSY